MLRGLVHVSCGNHVSRGNQLYRGNYLIAAALLLREILSYLSDRVESLGIIPNVTQLSVRRSRNLYGTHSHIAFYNGVDVQINLT